MINWKVSKSDSELIRKIVNRAMSIAEEQGIEYDQVTCNMDLTACHANGNPLDLKRLLEFPDFDFEHDIFGIRNCIDRDTAKLKRYFSPRCSSRQEVAK